MTETWKKVQTWEARRAVAHAADLLRDGVTVYEPFPIGRSTAEEDPLYFMASMPLGSGIYLNLSLYEIGYEVWVVWLEVKQGSDVEPYFIWALQDPELGELCPKCLKKSEGHSCPVEVEVVQIDPAYAHHVFVRAVREKLGEWL